MRQINQLLVFLFFSFTQVCNAQKAEAAGQTWVVFIENSSYKTFASINGPSKDVDILTKAFSGYAIDKIIHKKDLTKAQMEKFFSVELKALLAEKKVSSILLWYAGHGKLINGTGYWIPIDAIRDDEKTYYSTSFVKTSLITACKDITHTLVVTDACDAGPSFYEAMRDPDPEKNCANDGPYKSAQTFVSAGYDLANANSLFTETFAAALVSNRDACIPIDKIVLKVSEAVVIKNQKLPKFAKIGGFKDEGSGTFFFIKK
jgi:hypothetical protein